MAPVERKRQMTTIAAQVTAELRDRLDAVAEADDRKLSYVIRKACEEYVERHEAEASKANGAAS